jgi:hypothetical protein
MGRFTSRNNGMSDEPKQRPRAWIGWAALTLFVLYSLSIGPALRAVKLSGDEGLYSAFLTFYAPIVWAAQQWAVLDEAAHWYGTLWDPDPSK